jgi:hypothetical protein
VKARMSSPDTGDLPREPVRALSNIEIVALAAYLLGGESRYVDTEDIAVKANELAPGRFTWVKYPEQINIHAIKTHLWDAKSDRRGSLLLGSEKDGVQDATLHPAGDVLLRQRPRLRLLGADADKAST